MRSHDFRAALVPGSSRQIGCHWLCSRLSVRYGKDWGVQKAAYNSCKGAERKIIRESPSIRNQVVLLPKLLSYHHAFPRTLA